MTEKPKTQPLSWYERDLAAALAANARIQAVIDEAQAKETERLEQAIAEQLKRQGRQPAGRR